MTSPQKSISPEDAKRLASQHRCPHCDPEQCPVEFGHCHCGCGKKTSIGDGRYYPTGVPAKFFRGHKPPTYTLLAEPTECPYCVGECPVGYHYCHCGCGSRTAKKARNKHPEKALWPNQYILGHHNRLKRKLDDNDARTIRHRFMNEPITIVQLAKDYDVTTDVIDNILSMRTYREAGFFT